MNRQTVQNFIIEQIVALCYTAGYYTTFEKVTDYLNGTCNGDFMNLNLLGTITRLYKDSLIMDIPEFFDKLSAPRSAIPPVECNIAELVQHNLDWPYPFWNSALLLQNLTYKRCGVVLCFDSADTDMLEAICDYMRNVEFEKYVMAMCRQLLPVKDALAATSSKTCEHI